MVNGVFSFKYDSVLRYFQDLLDQGGRQGPGARQDPGPLMQTQGQAEGGGQMGMFLPYRHNLDFFILHKSSHSLTHRIYLQFRMLDGGLWKYVFLQPVIQFDFSDCKFANIIVILAIGEGNLLYTVRTG